MATRPVAVGVVETEAVRRKMSLMPYVCMCVCVYVGMCVCVYVCMCVCVYGFNTDGGFNTHTCIEIVGLIPCVLRVPSISLLLGPL
jgi:hypothetical protein